MAQSSVFPSLILKNYHPIVNLHLSFFNIILKKHDKRNNRFVQALNLSYNVIPMANEILIRLDRMDHLIRLKSTGKPAQFANRLGISERAMYRYLKLMKELGAPIQFCQHRNSYYYIEEGRLNISFIKNSIVPLS